jgi:hypothetical protein
VLGNDLSLENKKRTNKKDILRWKWHMKKIPLTIAFLLLIASSALCQHVDFTFDDATDFSKFKTYKWVAFKNVAPIDQLTDEQIKAVVDAAPAQKGLTKVATDTADLLIDYQSSGQFNVEMPNPLVHSASPLPEVYHGDLAIDMYTPANHNLVWRGKASKTLDPKAKPDKRQKNLNKAVTKLMKNYPPPK